MAVVNRYKNLSYEQSNGAVYKEVCSEVIPRQLDFTDKLIKLGTPTVILSSANNILDIVTSINEINKEQEEQKMSVFPPNIPQDIAVLITLSMNNLHTRGINKEVVSKVGETLVKQYEYCVSINMHESLIKRNLDFAQEQFFKNKDIKDRKQREDLEGKRKLLIDNVETLSSDIDNLKCINNRRATSIVELTRDITLLEARLADIRRRLSMSRYSSTLTNAQINDKKHQLTNASKELEEIDDKLDII